MRETDYLALKPIDQLVGTWRLLSFETESQDTGERRPFFGPAPRGRLVVLPDGMLFVIITAGGRQAPKSAEERAGAFGSMVAYSGRITVTGDQLNTLVDIAWNEGWVGTAQCRTFHLSGSRLELVTAWAPSPLAPERIGRGILEWEREA